MKVFGIGFHKTGSTTLRDCFLEFGYRHVGYRPDLLQQVARGDLDETFATADAHEAFQDWPWALLFRELDARYPDSRFILTVRRDSSVWLDSLVRHVDRKNALRNPWTESTQRIVYGHPHPIGNERECIERYEAHNRAVREWFAGRPERLLVACWEDGAGWPELCAFLGRPVPDAPFPRANVRPGPIGFAMRRARRGARRIARRLGRLNRP